ncbi:MAG: hypothetical protein U0359_30840 [Byssovorax sp.]
MTKRDTRSIDPELMNLRGELAPVAPFVDLATFAPPAPQALYAGAGSIPPVAFDEHEVSVALPAPPTSGAWRSALVGAAAALAFLGVASALPSARAPQADLAQAALVSAPAAPRAQGAMAAPASPSAEELVDLGEPMIVLPTQLIVGTVPREGALARAAAAPAPAAREQSVADKMADALAAAPTVGDFEQADARAPLAALPEELDRAAAAAAIAAAGRAAASCLDDGDGTSSMPVRVTFAPSGRVTKATIEGGPYVGSAKGGCIAAAMRGASVHAFQGAPTTVSTTVRVR